MRSTPERVAWVVLLGSFFACVAMAVATPLTARMLNAQGKEIADVFYMYVSRTRE